MCFGRIFKNNNKEFKHKIECIQTDNGAEFTNRLTTYRDKRTKFETALKEQGIEHKLIKLKKLRHNGKVQTKNI